LGFALFSKAMRLARTAPALLYRLVRAQLGLRSTPGVYYAVPGADWATDWVGHHIVREVARQFGVCAHVTDTPHLLVGHILHYGELGAFLASLGSWRNAHNTVVTTIFHGDLDPRYPSIARSVERFIQRAHTTARIVVVNRIMERRLEHWGITRTKAVCIPLGVDTCHFTPVSGENRLVLRRRLGIPDDVFCIGSFQKDGVGWGEGLAPKLIKGPDVFLEVLSKLHHRKKLFVLLTGPARGYVKRGLDRLGIRYAHQVLTNYLDIVDFYRCLDVYVVASREEGGPKAILESMATGIPLISTRVGMAPDVILHGENGLLTEREDVEAMVQGVERLRADRQLRKRLATNGLATASRHNWTRISALYYHQVYQPLLQEMTKS
jgi:glycosyltransferase involved in cell wall biosynthesis